MSLTQGMNGSTMRPYGLPLSEWSDESFGPPSRHSNTSSKSRRTWRRIMHKNARRSGVEQIKRERDEDRGEKES